MLTSCSNSVSANNFPTLDCELSAGNQSWMWWTIRPQWSHKLAGMKREAKLRQTEEVSRPLFLVSKVRRAGGLLHKKLYNAAKLTSENTQAFCVSILVNFSLGSPVEFERRNCQCFCSAVYLTASALLALWWKWRKWHHNFGLSWVQIIQEQLFLSFVFAPTLKGLFKLMQFSYLLSLYFTLNL